ncbi:MULTISPECIES: site-2 protease family protein [unclassified Pseudoalteromonas]|uniref:site-2 protease family protein n=1 Tax=unclassified Pseudoalteromonas TaxID=194690 RepID=UPI002096E6DE|nr:site-2 protease family protein [Pseudoalteromonas sp. XMcav2-N]MCO7189317.1 site-2 protease family protein [Pseudoalteromonas sp. XMcav2-N]
MTRIEFPLAGYQVSVLVNRQEILQVYQDQQCLAHEPTGDRQYLVAVDGHQLRLDPSRLPEGLLAIAVDNEPWQWLEVPVQQRDNKGSWFGLAALGFKLLKSANVVKAALAGASLAGYAWLFSWQFAVMLLACLVIHEYGHIRAMRYFGLKTKGIYLIPFVGGLAVSEDKLTTRWQNVIISLMGPAFGLLASLVAVVLYYVTGLEIFAGVAVLSALLNLLNMLPIVPLDGGHVVKSISFSMRSWAGLLVCLAGILLGVVISYTFGLMLLVFFLVIGTIDILLEWRGRHQAHLIPLDRYGQIVSTALYVIVSGGLIAVMWHFADADSVLLSLPIKVLSN